MLKHHFHYQQSLLIVEPSGPLSQDDFVQLAQIVDTSIENGHSLQDLMIIAEEFPGWETLSAMIQHFKFIKDHHQTLHKVALVSDSALATLAPKLASHFVSAEVRHFDFDAKDAATKWLSD
ncbi:STAS/SEC14 domain-containing protein [Rubritalea marina]|uniref:STAS/SEC14 domain-containing protein n=1 Tax=Rubritalea marina TaxID=361055 RepID=UPI00036A5F67|nr:STAS/SEC14 domain-containing protein [Rubritalea marina]